MAEAIINLDEWKQKNRQLDEQPGLDSRTRIINLAEERRRLEGNRIKLYNEQPGPNKVAEIINIPGMGTGAFERTDGGILSPKGLNLRRPKGKRAPLAFNLVEDSFLSPNYGKSYLERELSRGIITDPYTYSGRIPDEEDGGLWGRWKAYRKTVKEKWPLVRSSELKNIWKIPVHYGLYRFIDNIRKKPEDRKTVTQDLWGAFLDTYWIKYRESYSQLPFKIFPKLRIWVSYAEGATKIDHLYVIEVDGYEIPVFLRVDKDPEIDEIKKNIDHAETKKESVYDKMDEGEFGRVQNPDFIKNALDKYTKLDYREIYGDQPQKIHRALAKDDTWYTQQYGERDTTKEAALDAQLPAGYQGKVKIYKRPTSKSGFWYKLGKYLMFDESPRSGGMFWYWFVGDILYDIIDIAYEPVQYMMKKTGVTPEGIRIASELEYAGIAGARRGLFNPKTPTLTFKKAA